MQHQLKLKKPLAFFDLETTGINVQRDRIVEICIAKANIDGTVSVKTRRVNPGIPIPLESSLIHGIYDADVKDEPSFKQIAKSLAQFIEGCDLAGFNSNRFDVPMLVEEFLRNDVEFDMKNRRLIDAQRIFHLMEPRNLTAAYKFYCGKVLEGAHGAEADTLATLEVLNAQVQHYEGVTIKNDKGEEYEPVKNDMEALHEITSSKIVDFAQRLAYNKEGVEIINFGKHAGKPVAQVLKDEPSYYDWMMKGDFPLDTKRKLTEIKLRNFNNK
ncbi:DNA polymerase-3 subunit epsilon [Pseudarcicella hirudinis]|uniref:DNA polymerase-3 subunit epsilon n=1 Tax=Pseudarcicella hirudinis TaxID=1079859 RepID=A0A1I5QJ56_9BACT|nr:3'-5' exonuclease [Pseudarcicella hirudinis]SFP46289.1 DNA polymerase-3 subunit epsilon [Pseudarcicella hirudinis]